MAPKRISYPDETDLKLMDLLQGDGLATAEELACHVPLSPSAITRRVRRLRSDGWIERNEAVMAPKLREARLRAMVFVQVREHAEARGITALRARIMASPEVQLLADVAGDDDLAVLISARDMADFNAWTARMLEDDPAVQRYQTLVVKRVHKQTNFVPLSSSMQKQNDAPV